MPVSEPSLVDRVIDALARQHIPAALIGAAALAVHAVSRSTQDIDLLTTDPRALDLQTWQALAPATIDLRRGDDTDPLAGVIRFTAGGERDVDLVVGRHAWQSAVVSRAIRLGSSPLPVVQVPDLILLKLYAGGTQDRWDIEQLMEAGDREELTRLVRERIADLPPRCAELFDELRRGYRT
jgi:hypothetical protein